MKSVDIPKEIQQENKVVLMFTMRQLVCVGVAALLCFGIAVVLGMEFSLAVYPSIVIGIVAFAFGWVRQDGMSFERILLKRIQRRIYGNHVRAYHTKNMYVPLMNEEYARRREIDQGNRKTVKKMRKETRVIKKARKKQKCRGFA